MLARAVAPSPAPGATVLTLTVGTGLAITTALVLGALLQRVAGMGLGMVVAPSLTIVLGATLGVTVSNVAAVLTALLVWGAMHAHVDWGRFVRIAPLVVVGSLAGAWVVDVFSAAWLDVLVGATVLLALLWTLRWADRVQVRGTPAALLVGTAGGFMNTTSGVAAPAMTVYAVATGWEQRSFAATLQPIFLVANLTALVTKVWVGAIPPDGGAPWQAWLLVVLAVLAGVGLGGMAARHVSARTARHTAITIAMVGGAVALGRGLLTL